VSEPVPRQEPFAAGVEAWLSGLGMVRDAVRQELVRVQIASHLPATGPSLRVLDAGSGQGTQAIALARLGHEVVGVDLSDALLTAARDSAASEPETVQQRLTFEIADVLALGDEHCDYDLVCCHGVAMYLPSLDDTVRALVGATRRGGIISLLTRNRAGIAMRAGMTARWSEAVEAFDARTYGNRLGIDSVRADEPNEVQEALGRAGAVTIAWYGVRLFTDHWGPERPGEDFADIVAAEREAGQRDPFRMVAALTHTVARVEGPVAERRGLWTSPGKEGDL
jgi:S-adenosylmethionine-dependent methyltransferase